MKKIFYAAAAIAACTFVSCKDKTDSSASDTNAKYIASNNNIYNTIETGDVSKIKDWIASDAVDHGGGADGKDVVGGDNIIAMLGSIHTNFQPGFKYTVVNTSTDGVYLYTLAHMEGTTTATPGMGMPANQKMDMMSVDVVKIKGGKASEHWAYMNPKDMMAMMGHEGPGAPPAGGDKMMDNKMKGDKMMADTAKKM